MLSNNFNQSLRLVRPLFVVSRLLSDKVVTLALESDDVMDNFTTELIQKRSSKWDIQLKDVKNKSCRLLKQECSIDVDIKTLSETQLNDLIQKAVKNGHNENVKFLIQKCLEADICPRPDLVNSLFEYYIKDITMVYAIQKLVQRNNDYISLINGNFDHYVAESLWLNEEILKALPIFETVYRKHNHLRRKIRLTFKYLIFDVTNRSEAILVNIIKFSEHIMEDFKDDYMMSCIWQVCFISEWYTDQKLALDLLEKHANLSHSIISHIPTIVQISLRNHQVDVVQRLLEVLMQFQIESQYCYVLMALFNYKLQQRDLRSCSEIINWAVINNVKLPNTLHQKFLMLLLKKNEPIQPVKSPVSTDYKF